MRILFINSIGAKKWGGGEKWMLMAGRGLQDKGHEVFIGCAKGSVIQANAEKMNLATISFSLNSDIDIIGAFRLLRIFRTLKIDCVICGQNKDTKIAAFAGYFAKNVTILARHGLQLISKKIKYKYIFSKRINGIITNSWSIKNEYDKYGWFPDDFVRVIYNGVSIPEHIENLDIRKEFSINDDDLIILSVGRLAKQKGFDILIKVAEIAYAKNRKWKFLIVGKGKLEQELKRTVYELRLHDMVLFTGFYDNVFPLLKSADLFVLPSRYEGMPNAVMEAMAVDKCCVVTTVNGNNELIENNKHGLLVEPNNPAAIFEAVDYIASNPELLNKLGHNAGEKIRELFSEEKMIDKLEDFIVEKTAKNLIMKNLIKIAFVCLIIMFVGCNRKSKSCTDLFLEHYDKNMKICVDVFVDNGINSSIAFDKCSCCLNELFAIDSTFVHLEDKKLDEFIIKNRQSLEDICDN